MATIGTATTLSAASDQIITVSNQIYGIVNGTATETISTDSGDVVTIRKALTDNFYFLSPEDWEAGATETTFRQLRSFTDEDGSTTLYFAPAATSTNPITMGTTPVDDDNWKPSPYHMATNAQALAGSGENAISATQLKLALDQFGEFGEAPTYSDDLDDLDISGNFFTDDSTTNKPDSEYAYFIISGVSTDDSTQRTQLAFRQTDGVLYSRIMTSGEWGTWEEGEANRRRIVALSYNVDYDDTAVLVDGATSSGEHYWVGNEDDKVWYFMEAAEGEIVLGDYDSDGNQLITIDSTEYTLYPANSLIPYIYTAAGGETTVTVPTGADNIFMVVINGAVQTFTKAWTSEENSDGDIVVTFADELEADDQVVFYLAGNIKTLITTINQESMIKIAIARANNTTVDDVLIINSSDSTAIGTEHFFYLEDNEKTYYWSDPQNGTLTVSSYTDTTVVISVASTEYTLYSTDTLIPYIYTATGSETTVTLPDGTNTIYMVTINGVLQTYSKSWSYDTDSDGLKVVTFGAELVEDDEVVFYLTGDISNIFIAVNDDDLIKQEVAVSLGVSSDDVAIYSTGVSLSKNILRDISAELTLIAWDTLTTPYTITSYSANDYAGYDVVTSEGTFEFVTPDILELRNGGYGYSAKVNKVTNALGWGHDGTNLSAVVGKVTDYATALDTKIILELDKDSAPEDMITIDLEYLVLDLQDCTLDFSSSAPTYALYITSSTTSYNNSIAGVRNGELFGDGKAGSTIGAYFNSTLSSSSTRSVMQNLVFHDFLTGNLYANRAYAIKNEKVSIYACGTAVSDQGGSDSGENISYHDSLIFNNTLGVSAYNSNGSLQFYGCHLDYNGQQFDIDGSVVFWNGGHIEDNDTGVRVVVTGSGGMLSVSQSTVLRGGNSSITTYYATVDENSALFYDHCFMNNTQTETDTFYSGDGYCELTNIHELYIHSNNRFLGEGASLLAYPTFSSLSEEVFLASTNGTLTDIHTSDRATLTVDSGLTFTKITGSGSSAGFFIAAPMPSGSLVGLTFTYDSSSSSGNSYATPRYLKLGRNSDGTISIDRTETIENATTLTAGNTGTNKITGYRYRTPVWATHVGIFFETSLVGASEIVKITECYITKMG